MHKREARILEQHSHLKDGYTSVHINAGKVIAKYAKIFLRYRNLYMYDVIDRNDILANLKKYGYNEDGDKIP